MAVPRIELSIANSQHKVTQLKELEHNQKEMKNTEQDDQN
jgi:hypothetical protein